MAPPESTLTLSRAMTWFSAPRLSLPGLAVLPVWTMLAPSPTRTSARCEMPVSLRAAGRSKSPPEPDLTFHSGTPGSHG